MNTKTFCVIYARQSFGQEQDSTSIAVQQEACRKWAVAHGMQIAGEKNNVILAQELK